MTTLSEHKLTPTQISALVVLMAEARALSNAELKELAGFDLTGSDRTGLVNLDMIKSEKSERWGKPLVHEITDYGWRRIREVLQIEAIGGTGPARGALRVLLSALDRGFRRQRQSASSFFYSSDPDSEVELTVEPMPPSDLEQAIRLAYKEIVRKPGDWVRLPAIRAAVSYASEADVDGALARLAVKPDIRIAPVANLKSLSQEDRDAAIELGGELKHALAIEG